MTWTDRVVAELCARAGCDAKPGEAHNLCDRHAAEHRERNRRWKRGRKLRRAQLQLAWATT